MTNAEEIKQVLDGVEARFAGDEGVMQQCSTIRTNVKYGLPDLAKANLKRLLHQITPTGRPTSQR